MSVSPLMCLARCYKPSGLAVVPAVVVVCCVALVTVTSAPVERESKCQPNAYLMIQETCRTKNEALVEAEKKKGEPNLVCSPLIGILTCVARIASSECLQEYTWLYSNYFHSPHDCSLSRETIRQLQDLARQNAGGDGEGDGGDVDDVDVVALDASSSPSTPVQESSTSADDADDDRGGGDDGGGVTVADNTKGDTHKHTGNTGSSISPYCGVPVAVTSWLLALRMTSHLLRS